MGLNIPEEYGGFGASALLFSRVFGEVGTIDASLAVYFGAHQSIGCKGITLFGTDDQKRRWLTAMRHRRTRGRLLPHRTRLGLRRAGHAHDGHAQRGRHALPAERREDLDLQRRLCGRLHRVRQGAGRGGRQDEAARHRLHRRRARPRHHARQDRGEDGHQGERYALRVVRERAGAGRGPPGRGRRRLQDRAGDPELRAAGACRRIVPRRAQDPRLRARLREGAQAVRPPDRLLRDDPAQVRPGRRRLLRGGCRVDDLRVDGGPRRHRLLARDGGVQGVRVRARLPRRGRRAADRRRHRLFEGIPVRAGRARLPHHADLRGHERDPARAHRAVRTAAAGRAAEGARQGVPGSAALARRHRLLHRRASEEAAREARASRACTRR